MKKRNTDTIHVNINDYKIWIKEKGLRARIGPELYKAQHYS